MTDQARGALWFMKGRVSIEVSQVDSEDGVSVIMHEVPSGDGPPLHVHRAEDEIFFVVEGELKLKLGDETLLPAPAARCSSRAAFRTPTRSCPPATPAS